MGLRLKFNLILGIVCAVGFLLSQHYVHRFLLEQARDETSREARAVLGMALAIREHTTGQLQPYFNRLQSETFLPQGIPAFAARETMRLYNQRYPGHSYREVALNPTNPQDQALDWERQLIERYRRGELKGDYEQLVDTRTGTRLDLIRPLRVTDSACMVCHGQPADAPPSMLAKYGSNHGFGWRLGDVIGAQVLSIPADEPRQRAEALYRGFVSILLLCFALLLLALNLTLYQLVVVPINRTNQLLRQMNEEDVLTGARSRRCFLELLEQGLEEAAATGQPFSVITFDVDHFKRINDTQGHAAGDKVLHEVCRRIMQATKRRDRLGRVGGEEFAILLPGTMLGGARQLAETLREVLASEPIGQVGRVTASFGLAERRDGDTVATLLHRADEALYRAKAAGRNRVDGPGLPAQV
jgi:protein-histidine pros-kinase